MPDREKEENVALSGRKRLDPATAQIDPMAIYDFP
jgi:hypothetical protein